MQAWRDAPSKGDTVISAMDGERGTIVAVGEQTFAVEWESLRGREPIRYPLPVGNYMRRALPWE